MIHDLDVIALLVPSPAAHIDAVGIPILTDRIDIANARIRFADGCVANITASRVSMEKIRKLRLFQEQEYISLDYSLQQAAIFRLAAGKDGDVPQIVGRRLEPAPANPLAEELRAFLAASRGRARSNVLERTGKRL